jgi:alpha-amylase
LNHKAGADAKEPFNVVEVAEDDRNKEISGQYEIEGWTSFTFPGRGNRYSSLKWHHYHFTGVDYDARTGKKSIFKIQGDGKDWAEEVDGEQGNYDYLMFSDIDHAHPDVDKDIKAWGLVNEFILVRIITLYLHLLL